MSDDLGTTPIIADLKGRRVLVTGGCSVNVFEHPLPDVSPHFWPDGLQLRPLRSHADGLRHYATHAEGDLALSCQS